MKLILNKSTKEERADYREDICCVCGKECNPHYRFCYYSNEEDEKGNSLIDDELCCCNECYPKLIKIFT